MFQIPVVLELLGLRGLIPDSGKFGRKFGPNSKGLALAKEPWLLLQVRKRVGNVRH